jgi:hypothetical protein
MGLVYITNTFLISNGFERSVDEVCMRGSDNAYITGFDWFLRRTKKPELTAIKLICLEIELNHIRSKPPCFWLKFHGISSKEPRHLKTVV